MKVRTIMVVIFAATAFVLNGCSVECEIESKPVESSENQGVPFLTLDNIPTNDTQCIEFLSAHGDLGPSLCGIYQCKRGEGYDELDSLIYTLECLVDVTHPQD